VKGIAKLAALAAIAAGFLAFAAARSAWAQDFGQGAPPTPPAKPAERMPVLVELFTSEGCPHCPEADALLEKLYSAQSVKGAEIVALEEHVDYWDRPTWTDHYASSLYTERQKGYADAMDLDSLYTPQMVVDGLVEFVGNNESRARTAISALGHAPKGSARLAVQASAAPQDKASPGVRITASADLPADHAAVEVFLVVAEEKLFSRVKGGSNAGESWPHSSVARIFQQVGEIPAGEKHFSRSMDVAFHGDGWHWQNLRLILIVQEKEERHVLALETARFADLMPEAPAGTSHDESSGAPPDASKPAPVSSKPVGPASR